MPEIVMDCPLHQLYYYLQIIRPHSVVSDVPASDHIDYSIFHDYLTHSKYD